jgi:non-ribosomal peptide synthetase component E (peptide arylation enzyme)
MNIAQHLERAARHFPDKPAILFDGQALTYADLQQAVDHAAHGLVRPGVQRTRYPEPMPRAF